MQVELVPAFTDNYIFLAHFPDGLVCVDPGDAAPTLAALAGRPLAHILITHHHRDHTGGLLALRAATGAPATGPAGERTPIPGLDHAVRGGATLEVAGARVDVLAVPGHTAGHIAFHLPDQGLAFVGDTLFALGCGRPFEGPPAQLFESVQRLAALPPETLVYCAHEYTAANARFALSVDPDNAALTGRAAGIEATRARGEPTIPTTVALERATNPFVRAPDAARFAELRALKDRFAG